jgi:hypothetical protein
MESRRRATALWNSAIAVVDGATVFWTSRDGPAPYTIDELVRAVEFLEALTRIRGATIGRFGVLPDKSLAELSREWKAWYEENGDRLRFDDSSKRVVLTTE